MSASAPDRQLQMRLKVLSTGLTSRGISVLHQGHDNRFDLAEGIPPGLALSHLVGLTAEEGLAPEFTELFTATATKCLSTGSEQSLSFKLMEEDCVRHYDACFHPDEDGVTIIISDVTEVRAGEAAVTSLLREVSHRSKNLLAIVQSVAMQTAHHSGGVQDFLDKFRGRLHALSSTQDLVTENGWRGTKLRALIQSQLSRVGAAKAAIQVVGEDPLLGPNAALHVGLAIHELAANAAFHGALSEGRAGTIRIATQTICLPDQLAHIVIDWQETSSGKEKTVSTPHFGTLVLERIVPLSVGGKASYSVSADAITYSLMVPADHLDA